MAAPPPAPAPADPKAVMLERLTKANAPAGLPESFQLAWVTIKESESVKFVRYDSSRGEKTAGIYIERLDDWDDLKTYAACCDIRWSAAGGVQLRCLLADCGSKPVWWKMGVSSSGMKFYNFHKHLVESHKGILSRECRGLIPKKRGGAGAGAAAEEEEEEGAGGGGGGGAGRGGAKRAREEEAEVKALAVAGLSLKDYKVLWVRALLADCRALRFSPGIFYGACRYEKACCSRGYWSWTWTRQSARAFGRRL